MLLSDFPQTHCTSSLCRGLVIATVLSLLFLILLRFLAGIMVWVMIVLVIVVIGYGKGQSALDIFQSVCQP